MRERETRPTSEKEAADEATFFLQDTFQHPPTGSSTHTYELLHEHGAYNYKARMAFVDRPQSKGHWSQTG